MRYHDPGRGRHPGPRKAGSQEGRCAASAPPTFESPGAARRGRSTARSPSTSSASGNRSATLVIHQNLPAPDQGTSLELTGTGTGTAQQSQHSLTVNVGDPAVAVTSNPSGITDCTSACNQPFDDGTDITLTASYDHSSGQVSWNGCTPSGDTCTLQLVGDTTVTVSFVRAIH